MSTEKTLGGLVAAIRKERGWTLREMSDVVGIPLSTLGKVETDKLSLSYDKIQTLTQHLGLSMADFFAQAEVEEPLAKAVTARRSVMAVDNSVVVETANYRYEYLCADLTKKRMVPIITEVKARSLAEFGEPVTHPGEEFVYVLEGEVEVHLEFYRPTILRQGQGAYIDSQMRHSYVRGNCERAIMLAVCSGDDLDLETTLVDLAERETA